VNQPAREGPQRISLGSILLQAFVLPVRNIDQVVRQTGVPLALLIGFGLASAFAAASGSRAWAWTLLVAYLLATTLLAVNTHRMVLMESPGSPLHFDAPAIRRLGLFALIGTALWMLYHYLRLIVISLTLLFTQSRYVPAGEAPPTPATDPQIFIGHVDLGVSAALFLVIGRLALLLPAAALDRRLTVPGVWRMTRGNAWRLAIVVGALPWSLDWLLGQVELANAAEWAAMQIAVALTLLVEVVAVSLAYRELAGDFMDPAAVPGQPPIDPHA
jgi:hypothetical protein